MVGVGKDSSQVPLFTTLQVEGPIIDIALSMQQLVLNHDVKTVSAWILQGMVASGNFWILNKGSGTADLLQI